jgi:hypothetical protein
MTTETARGIIRLALLLPCLGLPLKVAAASLVVEQHINTAEPVPAGFTARPVYATAYRRVIVFSFDTGFVEEALNNLLAQCSGRIMGISTTYSKVPDFLLYKAKLDMNALCLEPSNTADSVPAP